MLAIIMYVFFGYGKWLMLWFYLGLGWAIFPFRYVVF